MQYAIDRFNEDCERFNIEGARICGQIQEIQCQTAPYRYRIEYGTTQIRVYINGILQSVVDTGTRSAFDNSP
jgi:hypothetical protein